MAITDQDASIEQVEVPQEDHLAPGTEILSQDGKTTTVILSDDEKTNPKGWFDDLSETLPSDVLEELSQKYLDLIDQDIEARKDRDKMQADGLRKSGVAEPAPGGAEFEGASRVTHPVLIEAYIDFAASSIKELFPPNGPVRTKIEGKPNKKKADRATRKAEYLNWQLTQEIKSYRPELERLLTQLPVGGSQYMKLYWDETRQRPNAEFVPIDDIVLPYEARNFFELQRKFHRMRISDFTYEQRIRSGVYRDLSLGLGDYGAETETTSARISAKIEGKRNDYSSETGERIINEGCVYEILDSDPKAPKDKAAPYLITIDEESREILSIYRNWNEDDDTYSEIEYIVDFNFIPWRGIFALSLLQCMAGLPDALTGSLRALLDSALISTMQGGLKIKGNPGGASLSIAPTQVTEVDAMGQDDIRKIYMPIPFNQPSPMLFQLLGFLTDAAKSVVGTAEEKIAEAGNSMPMGTALALIEQGAKIFSSIHARLHDSQRRCLEIIHRLNKDHMPDKIQFGTDEDDFVTRADFEGPMDVRPVSDPNIFSETQRFAQIQFVIDTVNNLAMSQSPVMQQAVGNFKIRDLLARAFEMAKIPDYEDFLPKVPEARPLNPVDENIAMVMGDPVKAYEGQNHEAHIQVLLDFAQNPMFGASPTVAQKFLPAAMIHLQDHMLVWYGEMMKHAASDGKEINWNEAPGAAVLLAKAAPIVEKAAQIAFAKIPELIAKGMRQLQAMAPKPPVDPMVQIAQQQLQGQQQDAAMKRQQDAKEHQDDVALKSQDQNIKGIETLGNLIIKGQKTHVDALGKAREAELSSQTELAGRLHDNHAETQRETLRTVSGLLNNANNGELNE